MKRLTILFILLAIGTAYGQTSDKGASDLTPRAYLLATMANECAHTDQLNKTQRLKNYPFNKAKQIFLVSFEDGNFLPKKINELDTFGFTEKIDLGTDQIDQLTDVLYNVGYDPNIKADIRIVDRFACYNPRNGILFVNEKGRTFAWLEFCFECHGDRSSNKRLKTGTFCTQKYELLKDFFLKSGVKYVANISERIYSWAEIVKLDTLDVIHATRSKLAQKIKSSGSRDILSPIERKLMFMMDARTIYYSDLCQFYYDDSGSYLEQSIAVLEEIGASKAASALSASRSQWPEQQVPMKLDARRKLLLEIIDRATPVWTSLIEGLYDQTGVGDDVEYRKKENLDALIFKFLIANSAGLED